MFTALLVLLGLAFVLLVIGIALCKKHSQPTYQLGFACDPQARHTFVGTSTRYGDAYFE